MSGGREASPRARTYPGEHRPPPAAGPPDENDLAQAADVARELATYGVEPGPEVVAAFALYLRRIREWNDRVNLVSAGDTERLGRRHLLESFNLLTCPFRLQHVSLADAGSGAGFPGLPLAILCSDLEVVLIESVHKKARFLERIVAELGLENRTWGARHPDAGTVGGRTAGDARPRVRVAAERAEVLADSPEHRGRYGLVALRGFGPLSRGVRQCAGLVQPGGILVAFKGNEPEREIRQALGTMQEHRMSLLDILPLRWGEGRLVLLRRAD